MAQSTVMLPGMIGRESSVCRAELRYGRRVDGTLVSKMIVAVESVFAIVNKARHSVNLASLSNLAFSHAEWKRSKMQV